MFFSYFSSISVKVMELEINLSSVSSQQTFECASMCFIEEFNSIRAFEGTRRVVGIEPNSSTRALANGGWNRAKQFLRTKKEQLLEQENYSASNLCQRAFAKSLIRLCIRAGARAKEYDPSNAHQQEQENEECFFLFQQ